MTRRSLGRYANTALSLRLRLGPTRTRPGTQPQAPPESRQASQLLMYGPKTNRDDPRVPAGFNFVRAPGPPAAGAAAADGQAATPIDGRAHPQQHTSDSEGITPGPGQCPETAPAAGSLSLSLSRFRTPARPPAAGRVWGACGQGEAPIRPALRRIGEALIRGSGWAVWV